MNKNGAPKINTNYLHNTLKNIKGYNSINLMYTWDFAHFIKIQ